MWIPKWERDRKKGVDSPVPTQAVSNEEFIPRPQTDKQKQVEHLIGELAAYDPAWTDEEVVACRSDGTLMLVCCERDVDIAEFRRVLEEHLGFRGLK